jgi:peptide deformylase
MAIKPLVYYPAKSLSEKSPEVTDFSENLQELVASMFETMYHFNGIGLAAPQIGVACRLFVADLSDDKSQQLHFVNPVITERSGKIQFEEGCLSIPGYRANVTRASKIKLEGFNCHGMRIELECGGLLAVCAQHEIDHLDGILFIDHLSNLKRELFKKWWQKESEFSSLK